MKNLDFLKDQSKKPWYKQGWLYAAIAVYLLVVLKTMTFEDLQASRVQDYEGKIVQISSADGKLSGTIGLKREGNFLRAVYHLYIIEELTPNEVCFSCKDNPAFNKPCRSVDKYNYVGSVGAKDSFDEELSGLVVPVFCDKFLKPKNPLEANVSWAEAVCFSKQTGKDLLTKKFYFRGTALFESYEEIFGLDQFGIFNAEKFTLKDSCYNGDPGSNFEQTEVDKTIESGEKVESFELVFGQSN